MLDLLATPTMGHLDVTAYSPVQLARVLRQRIEELDRQTDSRFALEYVSGSYLGEDGRDQQIIRPRVRWIAVWPVTGGSEGHYIHVEAVYQHDTDGHALRQNQHVPISLVKVFGGWDAAVELSGIIGRWLDA